MSLSKKQRKFTKMIGDLIHFAYDNELELTFGQAERSYDEQVRLFGLGRSETLKSKHLKRLAVDFNLFIDGVYITNKEEYRPLGEYWESIGGQWGGRFGVDEVDYDSKVGWDSGHFEFGG